jgi:hypothetical protein
MERELGGYDLNDEDGGAGDYNLEGGEGLNGSILGGEYNVTFADGASQSSL